MRFLDKLIKFEGPPQQEKISSRDKIIQSLVEYIMEKLSVNNNRLELKEELDVNNLIDFFLSILGKEVELVGSNQDFLKNEFRHFYLFVKWLKGEIAKGSLKTLEEVREKIYREIKDIIDTFHLKYINT